MESILFTFVFALSCPPHRCKMIDYIHGAIHISRDSVPVDLKKRGMEWPVTPAMAGRQSQLN